VSPTCKVGERATGTTARRVRAAGVDGVLVGEHLLVRTDVEAAVGTLPAGTLPRNEKRGATI
jgi:hypothetical protein